MHASLGLRSLGLVSVLTLWGSSPAAEALDGLHSSVARVGDVDLDGIPDFALASRDTRPDCSGLEENSRPEPKLVWILSGRNGARIRTHEAPEKCADFGRVIADVGDVNDDGVRDLAIAGGQHVWVFSGAQGHIIYELDLGTHSREVGRRLYGGRDVDLDGVPDIAVLRRSPAEWVVLIYSGSSGELVAAFGCHELELRPEISGELYARVPGPTLLSAIALVPDRTGDGRAELALSVGGLQSEEEGKLVEALLIIDTTDASVLQKSILPDRSTSGDPWVIQSLGDLDGDGSDETAITMVHDFTLVYRGSDGEELRRHSFDFHYMEAEGTSLEPIQDLNEDEVPDYVLGSNETFLDGDPGFANVYSGSDGELIRSLDFGYYGNMYGAGVDVCVVGDANGDDIEDLAVHMPRLREVRVLSGADFSALVTVDTGDFTGLKPPAITRVRAPR